MNDPRTESATSIAGASEDLSPEMYAKLRKLAAHHMSGRFCGTTIQPTMLAHEAWLKMSAKCRSTDDPRKYMALAATTMRNILIDRARRKARLRHGGGQVRTFTGSVSGLPAPDPDNTLLLVDEGVRELARINPLWADVVVARYFGGFSDSEIAENLQISERSVGRHWAAAKVWLFRWMRTAEQR
jgi:RNA polymerase sigma factor (TIGR02999 family)